jgi:hypothetical protein
MSSPNASVGDPCFVLDSRLKHAGMTKNEALEFFIGEEIVKEKMIYGFLVFFLVGLMGVPALYAVDEALVEASNQAVEDESDPSAFEGDSDSMPGERAPESLPMDDAPVEAGVGIAI